MPASFGFDSYRTPVRSLMTIISASGIVLASVSNTMPPIVPVGDCAKTEAPKTNTNQAARTTRTKTPFAAKVCTVNPAALGDVPDRSGASAIQTQIFLTFAPLSLTLPTFPVFVQKCPQLRTPQ